MFRIGARLSKIHSYLLAATGSGLAVLLLSCGGSGGGGYSTPPPPPPPAGNTISVGSGGLRFSPDTLTVKVGTKVTFTWEAGGHSVVMGANCAPGGPITVNTGIQGSGFSQDVTMPSVPGDVSFFCQPHCGAGMTGVIHVTP